MYDSDANVHECVYIYCVVAMNTYVGCLRVNVDVCEDVDEDSNGIVYADVRVYVNVDVYVYVDVNSDVDADDDAGVDASVHVDAYVGRMC